MHRLLAFRFEYILNPPAHAEFQGALSLWLNRCYRSYSRLFPNKAFYTRQVALQIFILFLLFIPACSWNIESIELMDQDRIRMQLEDLFKRQNNASSAVMMLTMDSPEAEQFEDLLDAEQEMLEACDPLNEYAVRELEHMDLGIMLKQQVLRAMDVCTEATDYTEKLIKKINKTDGITD